MDIRLVVERGARRRHVFQMPGALMIIGRKASCGVRVPAAAVSRQHCRLRLNSGFLVIEDLDSANGTFLNGQRVEGTQTVRPGDRLKIGPVTFVVEYELDQATLDRLVEWESVGDLELAVEDEEPTQFNMNVAELALDDPNTPLVMDDFESELSLPMPVAQETQEDAPPLAVAFEEETPGLDAPLHLPADDQLRDFLSRLEDAQEE